jgi:2-polyprenyl-3-methyl-5-hydroxy-6-metoxy-1,4-benzoquinol methylase
MGWDSRGIEISENFASYAREHFGLDVKTGDIKNFDHNGAGFDVITLISVLQHTADPKGLLLNINKLLKDNGLLFIEIMNNGSLLYLMGDIYYKMTGSNKTTHLSPTFPSYQIYGFSKKSIKMILEMTGFRIVKIQARGGIDRTESCVSGNVKDMILRSIRKIITVAADLFNNGQVLVIYAIKEGSK